MPKLILNDIRCKIENEDDVGFLWALDRELSHMVQGAQHTRAYKGWMDPHEGVFVAWDGRNRLFNPDDMSFPLGLKNRVQEFYKKDNRQLEVVDSRTPKSVGSAVDILPVLKRMNKVPRPYQMDALDVIKANDCGIIRMATGSGKTLLATMITADIGKKTIIYVIGKDLLYQLHSFFKEVFDGIKIGIIGDGLCEVGDINVASVWTVGQALGVKKSKILSEGEDDEVAVEPEKYGVIRDLLRSAKAHILDECHIAACETIQAISKNINPEYIYGMSASPWRDDGADILIEALLGHRIVDISAKSLIKQGYLVDPYIKFIHTPQYPEKLKRNYKTIYKKYIVENEERNGLIFENAKKLIHLGYKPLILFKSINHGKILHEMISQKISCALLSGKDDIKTRLEVKNKIEAGSIDAIIASKIFDIGLDLPILSALINCGGGKASVPTLQRVGRVIRASPGKKRAVVVDFIDHATYLKDHSKQRKKILSKEFDTVL